MKIAIVDDDIKMYNELKGYLTLALNSSAEYYYFKNGEDFLTDGKPAPSTLLLWIYLWTI